MKTIRILLYIIVVFITANFAKAASANLEENSLVLNKPNEIISSKTLTYFSTVPESRIKVWIYFTDKGIESKSGFDQAAGNIKLTKSALTRRERVGMENPVFADIPVNNEYIAIIESWGAEHKRSSRWLNAASFMVDKSSLEMIASLPFVYKITAVIKYKHPGKVENVMESPNNIVRKTEAVDSLDYGASYTQMQMINAPSMHQMGYNGDGIIIGMFDSGFRKTHDAFAQAYDDGRVLAEYDFVNNDNNVQNEDGDNPSQQNHGTSTWSVLGGYAPGNIIGPAYGALFILAKTEDITAEYVGEEDNWIAALEWADSIGASVVSSSVSYEDWYTYEDFDGATAPITIAANTAAGLGIMVCNSIGNDGPASGTLNAPCDAYNILACGAVDLNGTIAGFSSRGPTYDGRTKPEVCAMGVNDRMASGSADNLYGTGSGTSFSTPLVGGAVGVLLSANEYVSPLQVRKALMMTADRSFGPDNNYGWGVIDMLAAFNWGANFTADSTYGPAPLAVQFLDSSIESASNWKWYFGDGDSSDIQDPAHIYNEAGLYEVTLIIDSDEGVLTRVKTDYIEVLLPAGLRGDADNNGAVELEDITFIIDYLYVGTVTPETSNGIDVNDDGRENLLDLIYLINYLYNDGPPPPA